MKKIINSSKAPAPIGPYNHSVLAGNMLFVSGQIPYNQEKELLVDTGIEDETHQVLQNIKFILEEAGFHFKHVIKATIFITNMDDFQKINNVYASYFDPDTAPARECVQVAKLPRNVNIEISVICHK